MKAPSGPAADFSRQRFSTAVHDLHFRIGDAGSAGIDYYAADRPSSTALAVDSPGQKTG